MAARLHNPYRDGKGQWVRGNFHGHCSEHSACASVPLADGVGKYRKIGAHFMAVTDHDVVTDLSELRSRYADMVFLEGFEYSTRENVIFVGERVDDLYKLALEEALARAGDLLTVVCHPQPYGAARPYWTREKLEELGPWPDGIEVYNGHYGVESALAVGRQPFYADFWDELLTAGHRLWGFANDDFHDLEDLDNAFNMILVEQAAPAAIVAAAKSGRSYATTGLLLRRVQEEDGRIEVEVEASCRGAFIGPGGRELAVAEGARFSYAVGDEAYVRFQAEGKAGHIFLQPMFWENGT